MRANPAEQQRAQAVHLLRGDRFEGSSITRTAASLHLDGDDVFVVAHHEIEFACSAETPVTVENLTADVLQVFGCERFAAGTERSIV